MNKYIYFFTILILLLNSCKQNMKRVINEQETIQKDTPTLNIKDTIASITSDIENKSITQKPLENPYNLVYINYYDKQNGISLKYPKSWNKEVNKYVPFKVTAPQENEADSMKENFYYVVIDETPNKNDLLNKNKIPVLSLEDMNANLLKDLKIEKPNRKNIQIISNSKIMINSTPAYEIISKATINGFDMQYRICCIKKNNKQYYLYFASEQYTYSRYLEYADMLFSSFYIN